MDNKENNENDSFNWHVALLAFTLMIFGYTYYGFVQAWYILENVTTSMSFVRFSDSISKALTFLLVMHTQKLLPVLQSILFLIGVNCFIGTAISHIFGHTHHTLAWCGHIGCFLTAGGFNILWTVTIFEFLSYDKKRNRFLAIGLCSASARIGAITGVHLAKAKQFYDFPLIIAGICLIVDSALITFSEWPRVARHVHFP